VLGYTQVVCCDGAVTKEKISALLEVSGRLISVTQIQGLLEVLSDWGG
jgi:hypothetical protein